VGRWDIHPVEVRGVLARTKGVAGEFDEHTSATQSALDGAATESSSDLVAGALAGFVSAYRDDMRFMFRQVEAAVTGAATAVNAYLQGDHEMVLNAQEQVAKTPDPTATMPGGGRP
jgi:hypothetical protein